MRFPFCQTVMLLAFMLPRIAASQEVNGDPATEIAVEVRIVTVPQEMYPNLGLKTLPRLANSEAPSDPPFLGMDSPATDTEIHLVSAHSRRESRAPVCVERLQNGQADRIIQLTQDKRSNVLMAPKIVLKEGQVGTIADISQRPFVTDIIEHKIGREITKEPVIQVAEEGTKIAIIATRADEHVILNMRLQFLRISDVQAIQVHQGLTPPPDAAPQDPDDPQEVEVLTPESDVSTTTLQNPESTTFVTELSAGISSQETLLVWAAPANPSEKPMLVRSSRARIWKVASHTPKHQNVVMLMFRAQ